MTKISVVLSFIASLNGYGIEVDQTQLICVAENVYHEARSESAMGQVATANVVINRVASRRWPATPCKVIHQPAQFSWHKTGPHPTIKEMDAWEDAVEIAGLVLTGLIEDQTDGSNHYYSSKGRRPWWHHAYPFVKTIGHHLFFRRPA